MLTPLQIDAMIFEAQAEVYQLVKELEEQEEVVDGDQERTI